MRILQKLMILTGSFSSFFFITSLTFTPVHGEKDCSPAAESGGACPQHGITSGTSHFWVDCDNGLAFSSHLPSFKGSFIHIPQLNEGNDSLGDIFRRKQEEAPTTVQIFDPTEFANDSGQCRVEVNLARSGIFQPFSCISNTDCPGGGFCLAPFGCAFSCSDSSTCPSNFICSPFGRCRLPKFAIGPADVVETRRATGPTTLVVHVAAHGILDLLDEEEEPTGEKVYFRANGRMVFQNSAIPVQNEVRIELQEYSGN